MRGGGGRGGVERGERRGGGWGVRGVFLFGLERGRCGCFGLLFGSYSWVFEEGVVGG